MRNKLNLVVAIVAAAAICVQAHAQDQGGPATATGGGRSAGPEAVSGFGKEANYSTLENRQVGGLQFGGRVVVQDAMFPWDPIPVIVTCNGVVRYRTEADSKGRFELRGEVADPMRSEITPRTRNPQQETASHLVGCDVQASLPGFTSSVVHIANATILDTPDIGTITLRPDSAAAGTATSATITTASKDAMKKFDKARAEWVNKNVDGAEHDLQKAVQIDPKFADAWYQLGELQQAKNDNDAALNSFQKAAAADPKFISPYEHIAELSAPQKKWQDVANATSQALKLDPAGTPQLWYFDALANLNLRHSDVAEASARKSLAMDPQHLAPNTEQLLAVILAGKGQYAEALKHLQNSLTYLKPGPNADLVKQQIAQLEKVVPAGGTQ